MRGITGLGGRGVRVVILSLFAVALVYILGNCFDRAVPYELDVSETGFYAPHAVDAQPPGELVSPEVTTLSDEEHPASAKWHHEAMSKIKDKIGAWLPMDKVHGMYGAMRRPPWMDHGKSLGMDSPGYNHGPSSSSSAKESRNTLVGKVSVLDDPKNEYIDRAVKTHVEHDRRHGYQHYIMREQIVPTLAENFAAQMLVVLQAEMRKPPSKRLVWLYHFPATSIILNPNVPLELFLPPANKINDTAFDATYLLYAAAAPEGPPTSPSPDLSRTPFTVKVNQWSVDLFTTLVTRTKSTASGKQASSRDAITISSLLHLPSSALSPRQHALALPPRWLNAWPTSPADDNIVVSGSKEDDDNAVDGGSSFSARHVRRGSFALVLPPLLQNSSKTGPGASSSSSSSFFFDDDDGKNGGGGNDGAAQRRLGFEHWLAEAEARTPKWEAPLQETWYGAETRAFWDEGGVDVTDTDAQNGTDTGGVVVEVGSSSSSSSSSSSLSSSKAAFSSLSNWLRPPSKASGGATAVASDLPSASSSHAAASAKPSGSEALPEGEGYGRTSGGGSGSSSSNRKTVPELKEEVLKLVREMEASVHNWRQEVSEEVRRATESRCGRAREALAEVELDYGDGENEAGQDQAARSKLQAVISGLKKTSTRFRRHAATIVEPER